MNEWTKNRSAIGCQRYLIRQDNTIYKFSIKSLFSSIEQKLFVYACYVYFCVRMRVWIFCVDG